MISQVYTYVKIDWIVHFKYVKFIACYWYFNKDVKQKEFILDGYSPYTQRHNWNKITLTMRNVI